MGVKPFCVSETYVTTQHACFRYSLTSMSTISTWENDLTKCCDCKRPWTGLAPVRRARLRTAEVAQSGVPWVGVAQLMSSQVQHCPGLKAA